MSAAPESKADSLETVLRLYGLAVEMADRLSARRAGANSFFLALQTGLAALLGAYAARGNEPPFAPDRFVLTLAVLAGLVLALAWFLLLRSYRKLNSAKFAVINAIEQGHFQTRPFTEEWAVLKRTDDVFKGWRQRFKLRDRYTELGVVERFVPLAFVAFYILLGVHFAGYL